MANVSRSDDRRPLDAVTAAREWLARGIQPVPIVPRSKKPRGGKGWNKLIVTAETIGDHFKKGDNVGGLWGSVSGGVVDIDLDDDYAASIAVTWLPSTFTYGRETRERTHYLYRCSNCQSQKWADATGHVILEIRSTGSQSVLPPSIHPSGEKYIKNDDRDFATIGGVELRGILQRVAGLALLARNYPDGGGRHDYVSAICGALLRDGWSDIDVRKAVISIVVSVGGRESDVDQRVRTIDNTIAHYAKDDKTYGWPTLGNSIDARELALVRRWLGRTIEDSVPEVVRSRNAYAVPSDLIETVPGLVGDLMKWSSRRSFMVQPVMDVAVGLMGTAMATMNRFVVGGWNTPLQPYMMLLAPTAGGKESALNSVYEFCRRIRLGPFCFQGFQSYHSMLDRLGEDPHMACWLWDEAARKLKSAGRSPNSPDYLVMSWLLSLYGRANAHVPGLPARGTAVEAVDFPYLAIMAAAQPGALMEAVTSADLATGVVNRFILFDCGDDVPRLNEQRDDTFSASMETLARRMRDRSPMAGEWPFVTIQMTTGAYNRFREFAELARGRCADESVAEIWGRANQNALVVAGIVMAGIGGERPVISEDVADWAIRFVRWTLDRWQVRIGRVATTKVDAQSQMVEDFIRDARKHSKRGDRPKQRELLKRGLMTRSVLARLCRRMTARELDAILEMLVMGELISTNEVDGVTVYWSVTST